PPPLSTLFPYTTLFRSFYCRDGGGTQLFVYAADCEKEDTGDSVCGRDDPVDFKATPSIRRSGMSIIKVEDIAFVRIPNHLYPPRSEEHTSELQSPYDLV